MERKYESNDAKGFSTGRQRQINDTTQSYLRLYEPACQQEQMNTIKISKTSQGHIYRFYCKQ